MTFAHPQFLIALILVPLSALFLLWAGKQLYDTYQINREVGIISSETGLSQRRYDDIVTTFPPIPTSNLTLLLPRARSKPHR